MIAREATIEEDSEVDGWLSNNLSLLDWDDGEDHWRRKHGMRTLSPELDGEDLFEAADACGVVLGVVDGAAGRIEKVIALDYEACTDAAAWASASQLPEWIITRYARLAARIAQATAATSDSVC
jgi:hypothetical protein